MMAFLPLHFLSDITNPAIFSVSKFLDQIFFFFSIKSKFSVVCNSFSNFIISYTKQFSNFFFFLFSDMMRMK